MLDFISILLLVFAIFKGYSKGLVMAVICFAANIIGLLVAVKLSAQVSAYMSSGNEHAHYSPLIVFALVMIASIIAVRFLGNILEKILQVTMLGWANRTAGIVLYALLYFMIYSILLFYLQKLGFVSDTTKANSKTYDLVAPWGPTAIDFIGKIIPAFRNLLQTISHNLAF